MAKIFEKNNGPDVNISRNTFDLSHASHLTMRMGELTPVYCQEVLPGDSFKIDPAFGLRFQPMVFPVQSKIHSTMHFFYVRNRNLYEDWMEYIGKTKDGLTMPYLAVTEGMAKRQLGTGSLGDYLGVPSTIAGSYASNITMKLDNTLPFNTHVDNNGEMVAISDQSAPSILNSAIGTVNRVSPKWLNVATDDEQHDEWWQLKYHYLERFLIDGNDGQVYPYYVYFCKNALKYQLNGGQTVRLTNTTNHTAGTDDNVYLGVHVGDNLNKSTLSLHYKVTVAFGTGNASFDINDAMASEINDLMAEKGKVWFSLIFSSADTKVTTQSRPLVLPNSTEFKSIGDALIFDIKSAQVIDSTDESFVESNPFVLHQGQTQPKIKINALPFRAYESIYNSFYRDETVDPFLINGEPSYNDYIRTHEGGADMNYYPLYHRNWEKDYFTSAQQTPQQGNAPLVGVSASGTFTFKDVDSGTEYHAQASIGEDGETITGISTYSEDMPKGTLRNLMDTITNGISINDFRNVNSLQRWLETNIRRGYKYSDQIFSHFGVNPAFKANDMPEFLGGIHEVVDVNQISQTTETGESSPLGSYAGQASCLGGSNHSITKYCDEHGYIIGIACVYPEPTYSQMLPKHLIKTESALDYFFPEFGHIGMQPITYNEICPLQVSAEDNATGNDTLNDVFGYQRAWSDYLWNPDEVHGDMRTNMSDFVISRVYDTKPELGHDFIAIDENDVNNVFAVDDDSAKIMGQVRFNISAKRPIPRYGIPSIE